MTIVSIPQMLIPDPGPLLAQSGVVFNSLLLDAAAEKAAWVLRMPKAGTLARAGFRLGAITTTDDLKVSFQDVSGANGDPDGTPDQFRTVASGSLTANTWIRTGLITSDGTDTGTKRTVAMNELVGIVVEFNSFVAGNLNIAATHGAIAARGPWLAWSYADHFTAAWAKIPTGVPVIALEYDDGTFAFIPGTLPVLTPTNTSYNSGSTPDEIALKFRLAAPCRASGCWLYGGPGAGTADFSVVLYDSDGTTVLRTVAIDANQIAQNTTGGVAVMFDTPVSLLKNTFYRLSVKPTTANSITLYNDVFPTDHGVAILDQTSGGQDFHFSSRTDAGAWSGDDTGRRPRMGLFVDGIDDAVSTGGGAPVIHRGRGREVR